MGSIRITNPSGSGTALYGSLRRHRSFVQIDIALKDQHYDSKVRPQRGDDTDGFGGVAPARVRRKVFNYEDRHGHSWYTGMHYEDDDTIPQDAHIVTVHMSHEQFAEMITATGSEVDCTVADYVSRGTPGERYGEDVPDPADIYDRMKRRMKRSAQDTLDEITQMSAIVDDWKATAKVKGEANQMLGRVRMLIEASLPFAVSQATEEMSKMSESATSIILDKILALEESGHLAPGSAKRLTDGRVVVSADEETFNRLTEE